MNAIAKRAAPAPQQAIGPVLQPQTFDQLVKFSEMVAHSDLVPRDFKGKPANVMVAVQMGSELGLAPMQALQSIAVVNGRPAVWGDGLIGLCRQSHLCEDIAERIEGEGDNRAAICVAKRVGSSPVTSRFSVADAKKAGLWNKQGPWTQYPDRMLQNRARGFALRDAFPDVLRGLKTVEELRDYPTQQQPDPYAGPTLDHAPEQQRPASVQPAAVDERGIPDLDVPAEQPPPRDMLMEGTTKLLARINAAQTVDDLHAIAGDNRVSQWRTEKLQPKRPELEQRVALAFQTRFGALQEAETGVTSELPDPLESLDRVADELHGAG